MDDLLGEVQSIKSAVSGCENSLSSMEDKVCYEHTLIHLSVNHLLLVILLLLQLSGQISDITEQLKVLEDLKMAAAKDSMGEAAAGNIHFDICCVD